MAEEKDFFPSSGTGPLAAAAPEDYAVAHELPAVFRKHGLWLNTTLVGMLDEHFSHRTERRGCGYTQATRHLAVFVNRARPDRSETIDQLFPSSARDSTVLPVSSEPVAYSAEIAGLPLTRALRALPELLQREESRLLATQIADLVEAAVADSSAYELALCQDAIKVGTCPLAEKYFLEISEGFVRRKGRINVWVSDAGEPLLIEKLNLGDSYSCISVAELSLNGVRLPPGCLFGVKYDDALPSRANRQLPGQVLPMSRSAGVRFLRFTTLAISPENRERAFTSHFRSQVDAGLFAPRETTIAQLRRIAEAQL